MKRFVLPFNPNVPEIDGCSPVNFFGVFCFLPGSNGEEQQQEVKHLNKVAMKKNEVLNNSAHVSYCLINDAQTSAHQRRMITCCFTCCGSSRGEADTASWTSHGSRDWISNLCVSIAFDCQLVSHKHSCSSAFFLTFQTSTHTLSSPLALAWNNKRRDRVPKQRP